MDRRDFLQRTLPTISSVVLLNTLFRHHLFGAATSPIALTWLQEMHELCGDLRISALGPAQWQDRIDALYQRVPLEDILRDIDFSASHQLLELPDLGVATIDPGLPRVDGLPERYSFIGRLFGMKQDRAIIPHGHRNMVSCHRVVGGEFLLRQYDRVGEDEGHLLIRPTVEEIGALGSHSSISDERNNVHWLVARKGPAYTFDVIVGHLQENATEIDNIDMDTATNTSDGLLRVKRLPVEEALKKYGHAHH